MFDFSRLAPTFIFILSFTCAARASISIPKNLTHANREQTLRIIGIGTSGKLLSDPYPLGGYSGFEVGVSIEDLPTDDLSHLGSGLATPQQDASFAKFTIGKGLYNNLDFFIQFTPYNRQDEISQYGGLVRYSFYQASSLPVSASLLVHVNTNNISNVLTTRSFGADLIGGINVNSISLFGGVGGVQATGTFVGGSQGVTDSGNLESENVGGLHTVVGASLSLSNAFLAIELDRYTVAVFSGKLGVRF